VLMVSKVIQIRFAWCLEVYRNRFPAKKPPQPLPPALLNLRNQSNQHNRPNPINLPNPLSSEPAPQPAQPTTEQPAQPQTTGGPSGGFLTGAALTTAVDNIVDMGFPREEVQRAMRASFNNADRAVEYLMTVSELLFRSHVWSPLLILFWIRVFLLISKPSWPHHHLLNNPLKNLQPQPQEPIH
jgi:hypothetical protein